MIFGLKNGNYFNLFSKIEINLTPNPKTNLIQESVMIPLQFCLSVTLQ